MPIETGSLVAFLGVSGLFDDGGDVGGAARGREAPGGSRSLLAMGWAGSKSLGRAGPATKFSPHG